MYQSHLNLRPTGDMCIPVPFGRSTKVSKPEVRQKLQRRVHRFLNLANLEADPSRDGDISKNPWYIFGMAFLESVWFRKTPASLGTSSSSEVAPVQMSCWKWRPDSSQFQKCLHFYHFWSGRIFMLHFVNPSAALLGGWHCCYGWQRHVMFLAVREHKTYQSWLMCLIILFLAEIFRHPSPRKAEASWCMHPAWFGRLLLAMVVDGQEICQNLCIPPWSSPWILLAVRRSSWKGLSFMLSCQASRRKVESRKYIDIDDSTPIETIMNSIHDIWFIRRRHLHFPGGTQGRSLPDVLGPGLAFFLQPLASQEEGNDGKAGGA